MIGDEMQIATTNTKPAPRLRISTGSQIRNRNSH
jgi:hypothetical protein